MRLHRYALLPLLVTLAACANDNANRAATTQSLPPAPLPVLAAGDSISWSSGSTETVAAIDGETVRWRDQDGNTFTSYRNFMLPSLNWKYPESSATTAMDVPPTSLWPLKIGNRAHFDVVQTRTVFSSVNTYRMEWECGVDAEEKVTIALGTFDTFRLRCSRFWNGSNVGQIVWSYAPGLNRVVRRTWTGAKVADELVAIGKGSLDKTAEVIAAKVRDKALETTKSSARARGSASGVTVTITPTATFTTVSGAFCRDFLQKISTGSAEATSAGTACRKPAGGWAVISAPQPD